MILILQEGIKYKMKIKSSLPFVFLSVCPWFICYFLVLGYLSESGRGKNRRVLDSTSL